MDIYSFVGSRDIREHLRTINYQPNAIEAAYLIYMSYNATLEEKMTVWEELMMTVPDRAMTQRLHLPATDSFYGFLRQYMEAQKKAVESFPDGESCIYSFRLNYHGGGAGEAESTGWSPESAPYTSFEICRQAAKERLREMEGKDKREYDATALIEFTRHRVYGDSKYIYDGEKCRLYQNRDFRLMLPPFKPCGVSHDPMLELFLDIWVDIPTPFRCGDIVREMNPYGESEKPPLVLYYLPAWDKRTLLERGFPANEPWLRHADEAAEHCRQMGDCSDMQAFCCGYDESGWLWAGDYFSLAVSNYLNLVRETEPLTGRDRLLYGISGYLKGESSFAELINTSRAIQAEEDNRRFGEEIRQQYDDAFLSAMGLGKTTQPNPDSERRCESR